MAHAVRPIPEGFHTITPHMVVRGVADAIDFYRKAFGAEELYRNLAPDGVRIIHAELLLGDSRFFLVDENPAWGAHSPLSLNGASITLHLYVEDVDTFFERAVAAGCEVKMPVQDCFWGERYGMLRDPYGHSWSVSTQVEDLSPAQIQERAKDYFNKMGSNRQ
jgi:PhnB protein